MDTPKILALISIITIVTLAIVVALLIRHKNKQKENSSDHKTAFNTLDPTEKSQNNSSYAASKAKLEAGYESDIKSQIEQIKRLPPSEIESYFLKLIKKIDMHKTHNSLSLSTCEALVSLASLVKQERQFALAKIKTPTSLQHNKDEKNDKNDKNNISKPKQ